MRSVFPQLETVGLCIKYHCCGKCIAVIVRPFINLILESQRRTFSRNTFSFKNTLFEYEIKNPMHFICKLRLFCFGLLATGEAQNQPEKSMWYRQLKNTKIDNPYVEEHDGTSFFLETISIHEVKQEAF